MSSSESSFTQAIELGLGSPSAPASREATIASRSADSTSVVLPLGVKRTAVSPARATRSENDGGRVSLKITAGADAVREAEHSSM